MVSSGVLPRVGSSLSPVATLSVKLVLSVGMEELFFSLGAQACSTARHMQQAMIKDAFITFVFGSILVLSEYRVKVKKISALVGVAC